MTATTPRKPRTPITTPATGVAKWIARPVRGIGILQITSRTSAGDVVEQYAFSEILHPDGSGLVGFRLRKEDGTVYDVFVGETSADRWECECPDAVYNDRPNCCKHAAALAAATKTR